MSDPEANRDILRERIRRSGYVGERDGTYRQPLVPAGEYFAEGGTDAAIGNRGILRFGVSRFVALLAEIGGRDDVSDVAVEIGDDFGFGWPDWGYLFVVTSREAEEVRDWFAAAPPEVVLECWNGFVRARTIRIEDLTVVPGHRIWAVSWPRDLHETPEGRLVLARAKFEQAKAIDDDDPDEERLAEAVGLYDEILFDLADDPDLGARECIAEAMFLKSQALFDQDEGNAALALVRELADRFGEGEVPLRRTVSHALFMAAFTLRQYEGAGEAVVAISRDAERRFASDTDRLVGDRILSLFVEERLALEGLGRSGELSALRDRITARFQADPDEANRERAARVAEMIGERLAARAARDAPSSF